MNENYVQQNKLALLLITIVDISLILGFLSVISNKSLPPLMGALLISMIIITYSVIFIIYKKDNNNPNLIHYILSGFLICFAFSLFKSTTDLAFIYPVSLLIVSIVYYDLKIIIIYNSINILINIVNLVYIIVTTKDGSNEKILFNIIVLISIIILFIAIYLTTKISNKINNEKITAIKEQELKQKEILNNILQVVSVLENNCNQVFEIVNDLEQSSETVNSAVSNITIAMENSIQSVHNQNTLTEKIHDVIYTTSSTAIDMSTVSTNTIDAMNNGVEIVKELSSKNQMINTNGDIVQKSINELKNSTTEIQKITSVISSISEQTNLLSLNASIESARAGEAGKGFSVVADAIRELSSQSRESADNISTIINELQVVVDTCVKEVSNLGKLNIEQNNLIVHTENIFNDTISNMNTLNNNISDVTNKINSILESNNEIINNIQEISSVSEETMASIHETTYITEETASKALETKRLTQELLEKSQELKIFTN